MADRQFLTKLRLPRVSGAPTAGNDGDVALSGDLLYDNNAGTWNILNVQYQNQYNGNVRPKIWSYAQLTDANGLATFVPPSGYFTAVHAATATVVSNAAVLVGCYIKTQTTTSITVQGFQSNTITTLLLGQGMGLAALGSGYTINLVAFGV